MRWWWLLLLLLLLQVHGFQGNSEDYYNPDNSCINRVLETKRGK